jgi:hypothetical protein
MSIRLMLVFAAAISLVANLSPVVCGQQPLPSSSSEGPTLRPKVAQHVPPQDYQMMMAILQQMLQQSANSNPSPMVAPPTGLSSHNSHNLGSVATPIIRIYSPTCPLGICPPYTLASSIHPASGNSQAPQQPKTDSSLLGTWQRKTDLLTSTVHIKPDHLSLEMDLRDPNVGPIKVNIIAEYFLLKDQRTIICYITSIDITPDKSITQDSLKVSKEIGKIQQAFVETAIVVKVAIYQDAFVISNVRIPLIDPSDVAPFINRIISGRYERADSTKPTKPDR